MTSELDRLPFGPISRRLFLGGAGAAAATLFIGQNGKAFAAETGQKGGTLTMAVWPDPTALVCAFTSSDQVVLSSAKMTEGSWPMATTSCPARALPPHGNRPPTVCPSSSRSARV